MFANGLFLHWHLLTLINDILDMAKIEAGKMELNLSDIALDRFIHFIAETIRVKATEKGLAFACEMAPDLPAGVRVGFLPPARLLFEVEDTGIGIDDVHLKAIFRPFEQVSDTRHRLGGTGLGLAISQQLSRLMGGEIHVTSRRGAGSAFSFELSGPVMEPHAAAAPLERTIGGYKGAGKTVLVVDDVAENRAVAVDMLSQLGFDMAEAGNGLEALEKVKSLWPALVLIGCHGLTTTDCWNPSATSLRPKLRQPTTGNSPTKLSQWQRNLNPIASTETGAV